MKPTTPRCGIAVVVALALGAGACSTPSATEVGSGTIAPPDGSFVTIDATAPGGATSASPASDPVGMGGDGVEEIDLAGSWAVDFRMFPGNHHVVVAGEGYLAFTGDGDCTMDVSVIHGVSAPGGRFDKVELDYLADGSGSIFVTETYPDVGTGAWVENPVGLYPGGLYASPADVVRWPSEFLCALDDLTTGPVDVDGSIAAGRAERVAALGVVLEQRPECIETVGASIESQRYVPLLTGSFENAVVEVTRLGDDGLRIQRRSFFEFYTVDLVPGDERSVERPANVDAVALDLSVACDRIGEQLRWLDAP